MQRAISFMQFRGGSSKGIYFDARDLPDDQEQRNQVLLSAIGRDHRQIDGMGGGDPLTSKVAIVSPSKKEDCDVDYLFAQVVVGENRVDTTPNCGNILAGVGAFALESGMIDANHGTTTVSVYMRNSGNRCALKMLTPRGRVQYQGDAVIDGVPGSAAPVICHYKDLAGSACGTLLPTGNDTDIFDDIEVTCIDNGMPVVLLRAKDFGLSGAESCQSLMQNSKLRQRLEKIRILAGPAMQLDNVERKVVPKMCLVSDPREGGTVSTRTFIPHTCHSAIGVLAAVSVATACTLPGTITHGIAQINSNSTGFLSIEHPSGAFEIELTLDQDGRVVSAGLLRTTRLICRGALYV